MGMAVLFIYLFFLFDLLSGVWGNWWYGWRKRGGGGGGKMGIWWE